MTPGASTASILEVLTPIWKRLLQRTSIGLEDNFFDLGGRPALVKQMFAEIGRIYGRQIPPLLILEAPTLAAQAALLSQPGPLAVPPILLLKSGSSRPPIFIAHGLGDTVLAFFELLQQMTVAHPIYGMQTRGVDAIDEPFDCIEDIAHFYLSAMRRVQPSGPYYLIGYSFGGLVAREMARQLTEDGEKIALLVMLDSYPDRRHLPLLLRARLDWQLAKRRGAAMIRKREAPSNRPHAHLHKSAESQGSHERGEFLNPFDQASRRVTAGQLQALRRYHPRFCHGSVRFVRASINSSFPSDPAAVWGRLFTKIEVETILGTHVDMLTQQSETLGIMLSRYVTEADAKMNNDPVDEHQKMTEQR